MDMSGADDEQFCLRWNNYQSNLMSTFTSLLHQKALVDITLVAEGQAIQAHRVVLSACSQYFQTICTRFCESQPVVVLKDVSFNELQALLTYIYTGKLNVSRDMLAPLLKTAEALQIKGLVESSARPVKRSKDCSGPKVPEPTRQTKIAKDDKSGTRSRKDSQTHSDATYQTESTTTTTRQNISSPIQIQKQCNPSPIPHSFSTQGSYSSLSSLTPSSSNPSSESYTYIPVHSSADSLKVKIQKQKQPDPLAIYQSSSTESSYSSFSSLMASKLSSGSYTQIPARSSVQNLETTHDPQQICKVTTEVKMAEQQEGMEEGDCSADTAASTSLEHDIVYCMYCIQHLLV